MGQTVKAEVRLLDVLWRSRIFWRCLAIFAGALLLSFFAAASVLFFRQPGEAEVGKAGVERISPQGIWLVLLLTSLVAGAVASWLIAHQQGKLFRQLASRPPTREEATPALLGDDEFTLLRRSLDQRDRDRVERIQHLDEEVGQLRAVLRSMMEGVLVLDGSQQIVFVNEAARRLLNLPADGCTGRKLWQLVRHRQLTEAVQQILAADEPYRSELEWNLPEPRVLEAHGKRLPGASSRGAVLVFHDVTQMRHLERVRQDFVANVSHELKTPLAAIQATVETLLDGAMQDPEHGVRFLQRIGENADRLNRLVLDLLSLGQIESGQVKLELESIPAETAIGACLERQEHRAVAKGLTLTSEPAAEPLVLWADEDALAQILDNLVDNAIKYTAAGGRIAVRWWADGDDGCVAVCDDGVGIPEKDLGRIFERFYRVDKARSREVGGTGLGLSIVKHLAQALNGSIHATSAPGEGSTFTLRLPRVRETELPRVQS